jgi:hypothetical protein
MLRIPGIIDLHCHFHPDSPNAPPLDIGPGVSALESARTAYTNGHRALVLKSHAFASCAMASQIEELVPGLRVFGGICTDYYSGGLNPYAVETALRLGAKIIWLPTGHSHQEFLNGKGRANQIIGEGIKVADDNGKPTPDTRAIFDLVNQYDAVLATGHTTAAEHYAVVSEFARNGKVLVTHAGEIHAGPRLSVQQCKELADLGATIELTALTCTAFMEMLGFELDHEHGEECVDPAVMAQMIRTIGYRNCTLSSDYGFSAKLGTPALGLQNFFEQLWDNGIGEDELTHMAAVKPAELISL